MDTTNYVSQEQRDLGLTLRLSAMSAIAIFSIWYVINQDTIHRVRLQSPITFVLPDQPRDAAEASTERRIGRRKKEVATAAQFDLNAVAQAEGILLQQEDLTLDQHRQAYIRRYGTVAVGEMQKFGIPASITIAQGLLETRAGTSKLASQNNNHFGIKCFSRRCGKGHCSNFTDDTHKDFFIKYKSVWESYRAHSKLLRSKCYARISGDYRQWAYGLKECGYASDPNYAESLIKLIRLYGLYRLDK